MCSGILTVSATTLTYAEDKCDPDLPSWVPDWRAMDSQDLHAVFMPGRESASRAYAPVEATVANRCTLKLKIYHATVAGDQEEATKFLKEKGVDLEAGDVLFAVNRDLSLRRTWAFIFRQVKGLTTTYKLRGRPLMSQFHKFVDYVIPDTAIDIDVV